MALTQESVLSLLIAEGGKVKKSDLVVKFRDSIDSDDPAEKERNRELFKTFVNNVAVVKEIDGVRYVVVRKMYQNCLQDGVHTAENTDNKEIPLTGEPQRLPARSEDTGSRDDAGGERRSVKSTKASEEPKDTSLVPLEQSEHEWLVKCATGHWSQVYGLLLRDNQLAEKRDFMSGFTALHWAAKCGNSDMLGKIIDLSKRGGVDIDVNAKTHGGYTPLHIAALHDQEYIMAMLVGEYGADPSIRDNCGKKAYHYLHKGISGTLREMLGEPSTQQGP
ncbi:Ankyrin repeat domain-containing protein SOWAHA [Larimichthys crocea]|uniref:Ankyrin repeat domain-containing protein SOWAHA n=1 Tax=Larimichthys crocea TaxID=215358 RepID=A0A6G0I8E8_LARCR|nr:Ankyrin repeat domain-containing protein SOWAHA [Larimichthys crocea]